MNKNEQNNIHKKGFKKPEFNVTEFTTLGELLGMVNLGSKPETTPTPKQLRETAGEPIAWYPMSDSNDAPDSEKCASFTLTDMPYIKTKRDRPLCGSKTVRALHLSLM